MAKYRLTQAAIIDDRQRAIGEEVEYDGVPGPHMEPVDAAAKKAVADRDKAAAPSINPDFQAHPAETAQPGVVTSEPKSEPPKAEPPKDERHGRRS